MSAGQLRGALVGAGRVSYFHMMAWEQISQASIIAIADPDREAAIQRGEQFGIPYQHIYASFEDLLAEEIDLDFVDLATSPNTHLNLVKLAAQNDLHITCQKPFAYNLKEAEQMIDVCDQARVIFNINENWRWRTWYREIKEILDDGVIGRPHYAKFAIYSDFWVNSDRITTVKKRGHGILMEWGIHYIDLMRYLFGEVESVYGRMHKVIDNFDFEQRALVVNIFKSGLTAYLDLSSVSYSPWAKVGRDGPMVEDARIEGDQGSIVLFPDPEHGDQVKIFTPTKKIKRPAYTGTPLSVYQASFTAAQGHFIGCLLSGETPESHAKDNYETLAITLAAYRSAEIGQLINIDEFKNKEIG